MPRPIPNLCKSELIFLSHMCRAFDGRILLPVEQVDNCVYGFSETGNLALFFDCSGQPSEKTDILHIISTNIPA